MFGLATSYGMNYKYTPKIKIFTVTMIIIATLAPAISQASFFDWLRNYGFDQTEYTDSVISQGGLVYANSSLNQNNDSTQNILSLMFHGNAISYPSSVLTVTGPVNNEKAVKKIMKVRLTAYSSTPDQTDGDPFTTANGTQVRDGIVAANFLPFNTLIKIPELYGDKIFIVTDRMNVRFQHNVDIWFPDRVTAIRFGSKTASIEIVGSI